MNRLPIEKRAQILGCLTEGMSMRATSCLCDVSINTVTKLVIDVGTACDVYQNKKLRNLPCKHLQLDEIWSFVKKKEKRIPMGERARGEGDCWTWTAIDVETRLVPSWLVGRRNLFCARKFVADLASRMARRVQLTTDGHRPYITAVEDAFGGEVDYAVLIKLYDSPSTEGQRRYSPAICCGTIRGTVCGNPDEDQVSTSYVERQNLTMRMHMRRFTRLTNGFSKKMANHACAVALHYMFYNFGRIHKTLRVTPAMQAGITERVWSLEEIAKLAD